MKIYYDHHIFTQQKYGGISRYIYELSKNLEKIGQNSTIVAPIHINPYLKKNTNTVGWYIDRYPKFTNLLCRKVNSIVSQSYFMGKKEAILHETYYSEFSLAPK